MSCFLKQCYSLLKGFAWSKKIVIGEVYTKGSGDSIDYSITIVSLFLNPLKIKFLYFNCIKFHFLIFLSCSTVGEHYSKDSTDTFKFGNVFLFGILKCYFILPAPILSFPFTLNLHNPLTPMSDQDRISPYNINTISTR